MALQADVFDSKLVRGILKGLLKSNADKVKFEQKWTDNVNKCLTRWTELINAKKATPAPRRQLEFEAEVVEYVDYLHAKLAVHGNASQAKKDMPRTIDKSIPLLGPRFVGPSFLHSMRRNPTPAIRPEQAYIQAITIIHPVFYPNIGRCPQCEADSPDKVHWECWTSTGARNVYGIRANERALGYQLRCKDCEMNKTLDGGHCFAATNRVFWAKWDHWRIPRSVPYFLKRSAVTHELFDLIMELRPSSTSAGIAENLKQLHLLEHRERMLEYLTSFQSARQNPLARNRLANFSSPTDNTGYNDAFISNDLITQLYLEFTAKTRKSESIEYAKTRTAKSISLDNTFKSAGKAVLVDKDGRRSNPLKGGILSALNEMNEGVTWRLCMSPSPAEIKELLAELLKRHNIMGVPKPSAVVVDNCCQVRRFIHEAIGLDVAVILDVYHFMMRYGAVIYNGTRNPYRSEVLLDIRNAIIKEPAQKNQPALYWAQPEQEVKIIEAYNRWDARGDIWTLAAANVHKEQLSHVRKGCLARPREDIAMDGSRIEGSHKGWNSLQRAQPSGIEVYSGLAHDFFLRRNIRVGMSRIENNRTINLHEFVASTHSSHHVRLVSYTAELTNSLYERESTLLNVLPPPLAPMLPHIPVAEMIGLVESDHSVTFGGLAADTKSIEDDLWLQEIDARTEDMDHNMFLRSLGITDPRHIATLAARIQGTVATLMASTAGASSTNAIQVSSSATVNLSTTHAQAPSPNVTSRLTVPSAMSLKRKELPVSDTMDPEEHVGGDDSPEPLKHRRFTGPQAGAAEISDHLSASELPVSTAAEDEVDCQFQPTDAVIHGDFLLPKTSNTASAVDHAFFRFLTPTEQPHLQTEAASIPSTASTSPQLQMSQPSSLRPLLESLRRPLPIPAEFRGTGLTRSQLLFSLGTSIDPRALQITGDAEFYLFMDMRIEFQWTTFGMTSVKWASATNIFNERLEVLAKTKKFAFIKKNPRALMDKLNEIEPKVAERILKGNYISKRSQSDTFWTKHCAAVPALVKTEDSGGNISGNTSAGSLKKSRKPQTCSRCMTIMYPPGNKALNHKKGVCADGVAQLAKPGALDADLPDWPQPKGIFVSGEFFNPSVFLFAVRNIYEKVVESRATAVDLTLEEQAFSRMLESRTKVVDGHSVFLLYENLTFIGGSFESLISVIEGRRHLRLDCFN